MRLVNQIAMKFAMKISNHNKELRKLINFSILIGSNPTSKPSKKLIRPDSKRWTLNDLSDHTSGNIHVATEL